MEGCVPESRDAAEKKHHPEALGGTQEGDEQTADQDGEGERELQALPVMDPADARLGKGGHSIIDRDQKPGGKIRVPEPDDEDGDDRGKCRS